MCIQRELWQAKLRWWTRDALLSQLLTDPPGERWKTSSDLLLTCKNIHTSQWHKRVPQRVNVSKPDHQRPWTCLTERCVSACLNAWLSAHWIYRGMFAFFNRSAEEVMPQSMSLPSCIIALLCHCQRLATATSDCFLLSLFLSVFFFYPFCPVSISSHRTNLLT